MPPAVPDALGEAAAWCSRAPLLGDQRRSRALDPSAILRIPSFDGKDVEAWIQASSDSYGRAVAEINRKRSALLSNAGESIFDLAAAQSRGKLLIYWPLETVSDGAAAAASRGFFDDEDAPPWDCWFLYSEHAIISWVPEPLVELALAGIDANPVDCIRLAEWPYFSSNA
jgi:hypothetical protein